MSERVEDQRVMCTTADCEGFAEHMVTCQDEGAYPYCQDCTDTLISGCGEEIVGPVDDPVVAERDRYRQALEEIAALPDVRADEGAAMAQRALGVWGNSRENT